MGRKIRKLEEKKKGVAPITQDNALYREKRSNYYFISIPAKEGGISAQATKSLEHQHFLYTRMTVGHDAIKI